MMDANVSSDRDPEDEDEDWLVSPKATTLNGP